MPNMPGIGRTHWLRLDPSYGLKLNHHFQLETMKTSRLLIILCLVVCGLALVSPAHLCFYSYQSGRLVSENPRTARIIPPLSILDFNGDGSPDRIELNAGRLNLQTGENVLYQSPQEWDVRQAEFGDLNRDGRPEIILLVWRDFEPWPIDRLLPAGGRIEDFHDAQNRSCHIILLAWGKNGVREAWAGSALADPVTGFATGDLDGDGREELLTMEGDYDHPGFLPANGVKIWEWNGFGFTRLEQISLPARQIFINKFGDGSQGLIVSTFPVLQCEVKK